MNKDMGCLFLYYLGKVVSSLLLEFSSACYDRASCAALCCPTERPNGKEVIAASLLKPDPTASKELRPSLSPIACKTLYPINNHSGVSRWILPVLKLEMTVAGRSPDSSLWETLNAKTHVTYTQISDPQDL